jgi:peptide deformylase
LGDEQMSEEFIIDTGAAVAEAENITPLPLFDENHPMLRQAIPEYDIRKLPSPLTTKLVKRLKMTMKLHNGLGLSANQCGVFERIFVIGSGENVWACINPKIIASSDDIEKDKEGCLSFPGLSVSIDRPKWVEVEYYNENGGQVQMRFDGLTARCFQHELDHMNGVRMVDKVKPLALQMAREKQKKLIKKIMRFRKQYD